MILFIICYLFSSASAGQVTDNSKVVRPCGWYEGSLVKSLEEIGQDLAYVNKTLSPGRLQGILDKKLYDLEAATKQVQIGLKIDDKSLVRHTRLTRARQLMASNSMTEAYEGYLMQSFDRAMMKSKAMLEQRMVKFNITSEELLRISQQLVGWEGTNLDLKNKTKLVESRRLRLKSWFDEYLEPEAMLLIDEAREATNRQREMLSYIKNIRPLAVLTSIGLIEEGLTGLEMKTHFRQNKHRNASVGIVLTRSRQLNALARNNIRPRLARVSSHVKILWDEVALTQISLRKLDVNRLPAKKNNFLELNDLSVTILNQSEELKDQLITLVSLTRQLVKKKLDSITSCVG